MASPPDRRTSSDPVPVGTSIYRSISEVVLTGIAIIVPIVVTAYVLWVALSFVENALQPFVEFLRITGVFALLDRLGFVDFLIGVGLYDPIIGTLSQLIAVIALIGIVLFAGTVASHPHGQRLVDYFDVFIEAIPGVGTVYKSFRRMGDIMLDDEVDNFQEVKLVGVGEERYVIGFVVGDSPPVVEDALENDVMTMFIPFAPNPVTGGFLSYVPADRLVDVDMTVEEGIRNVITSGVAGHESDRATADLSPDDVRDLIDGGAVRPDALLFDAGSGSRCANTSSPGDESPSSADASSRSSSRLDGDAGGE